MCVLIFSTTLSEIVPILRIQRGIIINVHMPLCKVPVILVRFECNLSFMDRYQISKQSVEREPSCSIRTNAQTDRQT
jgi:hypothetical protein